MKGSTVQPVRWLRRRGSVHPEFTLQPEVCSLLSFLLDYPDEAAVSATPEVVAAADALVPSPAKVSIEGFLRWWTANTAFDLARNYVATFDLARRTSLHLTWYLEGDRRQRGTALLSLKQHYSAAGLYLGPEELPDYLPVVLEFAASASRVAAARVLVELQPALELLRLALAELQSPYESLVKILCDAAGTLDDNQAARVRLLAKEGPPTEAVGLEPYLLAPPSIEGRWASADPLAPPSLEGAPSCGFRQ